MNEKFVIMTEDVEDVVKASKQIQNKMRQDIQTLGSFRDRLYEVEDIPPIWDSINLDPYVKNVAGYYIMENSQKALTTSKVDSRFRNGSVKSMNRRDESSLCSPKVPQVEPPKAAKLSPETKHPTKLYAGNQRNLLESTSGVSVSKSARIKGPIKTASTGTSAVSVSKAVRVQNPLTTVSTSSFKQSVVKHPSRRPKLPLQRFAGSSLETIDFSKKHPNLRLHTIRNQSTVFPRRSHKNSEKSSSRTEESINLASAEMREPKRAVSEISIPGLLKVLEQNEKHSLRKTDFPVEKKTWKEVFMTNKSDEKPKEVKHAKMPDTTKLSLKKSSVTDELRDVSIICTPYRGLYNLETKGEQLSKQKKCSLRRLPVMCIRPECQVQQVAHISIQGDGCTDQDQKTLEKAPPNVGYVECRHDNSKIVSMNHSQVNSPRKVEDPVPTESTNVPTAKSSNKFIDALESTELFLSKSVKSSTCLRSERTPTTTTPTDSLTQSELLTGTSPIERANDIKEACKRTIQTASKSVGIRIESREVCIQTDFTKILSESPSGVPQLKSSDIPSLVLSEVTAETDRLSLYPENAQITYSVTATDQSQTQDDRTFSEDYKLSQQMRNDASKRFEKVTEHFKRQPRYKKKSLSRVELFQDDTSSDQTVPSPPQRKTKQYSKNLQSTQTQTTLSEGELAEDEAKNAPQHHSMEKEVKRAVNIFLNSLTSDFYSGHENTRDNILPDVQHRFRFSRWEPKSRASFPNYDSSSSSEKKCEPLLDDFTSFSISSPLSSNEESDSMAQSKISTQSEKVTSDSLSEGEILSVGEV